MSGVHVLNDHGSGKVLPTMEWVEKPFHRAIRFPSITSMTLGEQTTMSHLQLFFGPVLGTSSVCLPNLKYLKLSRILTEQLLFQYELDELEELDKEDKGIKTHDLMLEDLVKCDSISTTLTQLCFVECHPDVVSHFHTLVREQLEHLTIDGNEQGHLAELNLLKLIDFKVHQSCQRFLQACLLHRSKESLKFYSTSRSEKFGTL
ncbi:hypothetical protein T439DRAFT_138569 [Meredithblackwellia eburnea MCA 4105]